MIEMFGLNTDALNAEVEYRRSTLVRGHARRPLPRTAWWRRTVASGR